MENVYEKGLAKAIGVSNFSGEQIERIMKIARIPIHSCQVRFERVYSNTKSTSL